MNLYQILYPITNKYFICGDKLDENGSSIYFYITYDHYSVSLKHHNNIYPIINIGYINAIENDETILVGKPYFFTMDIFNEVIQGMEDIINNGIKFTTITDDDGNTLIIRRDDNSGIFISIDDTSTGACIFRSKLLSDDDLCNILCEIERYSDPDFIAKYNTDNKILD